MVVSNFFDSERLVGLVLVVFMSFVGFPEVCRFYGGYAVFIGMRHIKLTVLVRRTTWCRIFGGFVGFSDVL